MATEPTRLTREELYEQVWSEPLVQLAKKFGISDVALAKRCRRMRIPLPGLGYWAKKQYGKSVRRVPLPKLAANAPAATTEFVVREQPMVADAPEAAAGPVAEQQRFEALEENRIVVADVLSDPHPLVATTIAALRRAKPNHQGYLIPTATALNVNVSLDGADRAMCILDALLKALDARGYGTLIRPARDEGGRPATLVRIREDEVPITLTERIDEVKREDLLPPSRGRPRPPKRWNVPYEPSPLQPRRDLVPSGQYSLRLELSYLRGIRYTWSDGKQQRIDQLLNDFVVGVVAAAEKVKENRLENERWERERRAEEARRLEEQRLREIEESRVRALDVALTAWREARDIREYVTEARQALEDEGALPPDAPIFAWLEWAEKRAARLDPVRPVPKVPKDPGPPRPSYWR
jgi:hypothetical protein